MYVQLCSGTVTLFVFQQFGVISHLHGHINSYESTLLKTIKFNKQLKYVLLTSHEGERQQGWKEKLQGINHCLLLVFMIYSVFHHFKLSHSQVQFSIHLTLLIDLQRSCALCLLFEVVVCADWTASQCQLIWA